MLQLTERHKKFAEEFVVDFNRTAAARRAGFAATRIDHTSRDLYNNRWIRLYIRHLLDVRQRANAVTVDRVVMELQDIAFCDILEAIDSIEGRTITYKDLTRLPRNVRAAIRSVKATKRGLIVTYYNKMDALEKLARYLGLYEADNGQQAGTVTFYMPDNGRDPGAPGLPGSGTAHPMQLPPPEV